MDSLDTVLISVGHEVIDFFTVPNAFRAILLLVLSMLLAYYVSNFLARGIIKFAQSVAAKSDNESSDERVIRLRQIETYLSVAIAVIKAVFVLTVGFVVWRQLTPNANASIAAISASTIFIVVAGQTLGMILRDITAGSAMIIEKWFNVGDFIKVEPYWDVAGVVERFTLRSTKIRALNGEVIWMHNQNITGVHVTPRGLRTMAVDVFMSDREKGEKALKQIITAMPRGRMMLARPLKITNIEEYNESLIQFTIIGQTAPGREWLIDRWFVEAIGNIDEENTPKKERLVVMDPIQRYADPEAEKRFKRAVRVASEKKPEKE